VYGFAEDVSQRLFVSLDLLLRLSLYLDNGFHDDRPVENPTLNNAGRNKVSVLEEAQALDSLDGE
jgi:hypothetical protein